MISPSHEDPSRIINVASVPQRSPFRYPGGKTWLIPYIRQWLASLPGRPAEFIEPFAGGGSVSLAVAAEQLADHVIMAEVDEQVAAVWHTILTDKGGGEWLAHRILQFDLTEDTIDVVLSQPRATLSLREQAFQTLVKNRVNRGGILAPGAGRIKSGENGRGVRSRWYPRTLARRILEIVLFRHRISFVQQDGLALLKQHQEHTQDVFYLDPPYTVAGKKAGSRLYTYADLNHSELFHISTGLAGQFLLTYDNAEELHEVVHAQRLESQPIAMKTTHHAQMTELLIARSLAWLRG